MKFKIKNTQRTPDAAELASWTDEALQAAYRIHLDQWMERSNRGASLNWRRFNAMDAFHLELVRRKYGSGVAAEESALAANFKMGLVPKGEN